MTNRIPSMPSIQSFQSAVNYADRKRSSWSGIIGHNTFLNVRDSERGERAASIVYIKTPVVRHFESGRIELDTGGWSTITTADRMDGCMPNGWGVGTYRGEANELMIYAPSMGERFNYRRAARYAFNRRAVLVPDLVAPGGFRVEGPGVERVERIVLRRVKGSVVAVEEVPGAPGTYRNAANRVPVSDPMMGKGARSGHPDAARVIEELSQNGIRAEVVRSLDSGAR